MAAPSAVAEFNGSKGLAAAKTLSKSECTYTHCYCEENVCMLCRQLAQLGLAEADSSDLVVVFISNAARKVILWEQQAGDREAGQVCWDYHVLCIQIGSRAGGGGGAQVWDLDSRLPFPVPLGLYVREAFWAGRAHMLALAPEYRRLFRAVRAPEFLLHFASDRSHMLDPESGDWLQPPPPYKCIRAEDGAVNNLEDYVSMSLGDVAKGRPELKGHGPISSLHVEGGPMRSRHVHEDLERPLASAGLKCLEGWPKGVVLDEEGLLRLFAAEVASVDGGH